MSRSAPVTTWWWKRMSVSSMLAMKTDFFVSFLKEIVFMRVHVVP